MIPPLPRWRDQSCEPGVGCPSSRDPKCETNRKALLLSRSFFVAFRTRHGSNNIENTYGDLEKWRLAAITEKGHPLEMIARVVPFESFRAEIEARR